MEQLHSRVSGFGFRVPGLGHFARVHAFEAARQHVNIAKHGLEVTIRRPGCRKRKQM